MLIPFAVVAAFRSGGTTDGFKVPKEWVFRKGDLVFTLYDWKATDLYASGMCSPEELWASREPFPLHIGSNAPATAQDVERFTQYLKVNAKDLE